MRDAESLTGKREEKDIGRETGAAYLINGTVQIHQAGGEAQLQVTAILTSTDDATVLWSDRYSGTLDDLLAIQTDVAARAADGLGAELAKSDDGAWSEALEALPTDNLLAYDFSDQGIKLAKKIEHGKEVVVVTTAEGNDMAWRTAVHCGFVTIPGAKAPRKARK